MSGLPRAHPPRLLAYNESRGFLHALGSDSGTQNLVPPAPPTACPRWFGSRWARS
jgi:hypothetical protein